MKGTDIKALRDRRGETQAQFAQHFGVSRTTIIKWEADGPPNMGPARKLLELVMAKLGGKNGFIKLDSRTRPRAAATGD